MAIALLVPETYHPVLLQRKAMKIQKETGDGRWKAPTEHIDRSLLRTIVHSIYRPFLLLLLEPMCSNLCIFSALLLGILYLFFGCFPLVFENNHTFQAWQVGLSFLGKFFAYFRIYTRLLIEIPLGIFVGIIIAILSDPLWHKLWLRLCQTSGKSEPEYRLPPAIGGSILVPVGLFW